MANRYKGRQVKEALYAMVSGICDKVYTDRPTATEQMDKFVVIRLPQGITPYADTHNIAYVQISCFSRDRQGGVVNEDALEELVDGVVNLLPFDTDLMSCNEKARIFGTTGDGMGFHSTIIQFKIIIKV